MQAINSERLTGAWRRTFSTAFTHIKLLLLLLLLLPLLLKGKGKAVPLQAWTGPEGFRSLSLPDFKTIVT